MSRIADALSTKYKIDRFKLYHWPRGGGYNAGTFKSSRFTIRLMMMSKPDHFREVECCCDCKYLLFKGNKDLQFSWCLKHSFIICYNYLDNKYDFCDDFERRSINDE